MPRTKDGKLWIAFTRVGQGDCSLIRCPNGDVYVVDIGTTEAEPFPGDPNSICTPIDLLTSDDFFGQNTTCAGLILTHSDADHYNWVGLLYDADVMINKVYHSDWFTAYDVGSEYVNPKGKVKRGKTWSLIENMCLDASNEPDYPNIRMVTFTDTDKKFSTPDPLYPSEYIHANITVGTGVDQYSTTRGIKVHDAAGCTIHILCGNIESAAGVRAAKRQGTGTTNNYERRRREGVDTNMASLVVLVEYNGLQYLICGDAVQETEEFVLDTYPDVKNVQILRAPHHGSNTYGSSHDAFVTRMNPRTLAVSAPRQSHSQPLPTCETLTRYLSGSRIVKTETGGTPAEVTYGCFYLADAPSDPSHVQGKSARSWYNPAAKKKAALAITGSFDDMLYVIG